ncbi:hypothetical protein GUJ93_ZPchr0008g11709 [Zizania palustris]|uniref:Uncharacterized protein n=1 Tax=Zizania palustris TaxID=103762 RepID=A0A8J5RBR6_ZIZPA|nr:hypothetical protein GUJ93_ZPchr0008g11709 [Zizania palustris]
MLEVDEKPKHANGELSVNVNVLDTVDEQQLIISLEVLLLEITQQRQQPTSENEVHLREHEVVLYKQQLGDMLEAPLRIEQTKKKGREEAQVQAGEKMLRRSQ